MRLTESISSKTPNYHPWIGLHTHEKGSTQTNAGSNIQCRSSQWRQIRTHSHFPNMTVQPSRSDPRNNPHPWFTMLKAQTQLMIETLTQSTPHRTRDPWIKTLWGASPISRRRPPQAMCHYRSRRPSCVIVQSRIYRNLPVRAVSSIRVMRVSLRRMRMTIKI